MTVEVKDGGWVGMNKDAVWPGCVKEQRGQTKGVP